MTYIRFTSRVDPTWNGRAPEHKSVSGRQNVVRGKGCGEMSREDVCHWMDYWAWKSRKTCKKPPKTP